MSNKFTVLAASSVLVVGVAFASLAQQAQNAPPPRSDQGMMGNRNMPMMDMSQQMNQMMEGCNRMMQSNVQQQPAPAPQPEKKS